MQCSAEKAAPPGVNQRASTAVIVGRVGVRHLRAGELSAVRRMAAASAFALHHHAPGPAGDLLSPEFSPNRPPARPQKRGPARVVPLRPDLVGWTLPLTAGAPVPLVPGRGRHHRPEQPTVLSLADYAHSRPSPAPAPASPAPTPVRTPGVKPLPSRPRIRRCASRVRTYVSHPARDLAPLALAVRAYLATGVR
ncbi:hypothetical protein PWG71_07445 [Nocardiopsis sp. N85]|uniref:hypothetical protein n=1 Tax=Nocardiopsis sp. N85 TaxID=3029400 RepID=UPI00237EFA46|nr:hypothetical protein [Nocardiopsis sp. N85]MDE3721219.1 hypothetical protein [Nocardiopsis sp. N85]